MDFGGLGALDAPDRSEARLQRQADVRKGHLG